MLKNNTTWHPVKLNKWLHLGSRWKFTSKTSIPHHYHHQTSNIKWPCARILKRALTKPSQKQTLSLAMVLWLQLQGKHIFLHLCFSPETSKPLGNIEKIGISLSFSWNLFIFRGIRIMCVIRWNMLEIPFHSMDFHGFSQSLSEFSQFPLEFSNFPFHFLLHTVVVQLPSAKKQSINAMPTKICFCDSSN